MEMRLPEIRSHFVLEISLSDLFSVLSLLEHIVLGHRTVLEACLAGCSSICCDLSCFSVNTCIVVIEEAAEALFECAAACLGEHNAALLHTVLVNASHGSSAANVNGMTCIALIIGVSVHIVLVNGGMCAGAEGLGLREVRILLRIAGLLGITGLLRVAGLLRIAALLGITGLRVAGLLRITALLGITGLRIAGLLGESALLGVAGLLRITALLGCRIAGLLLCRVAGLLLTCGNKSAHALLLSL